jgi:8-oxo-dGTP pyrophosphatase MutT (NUDIX family)
LRTERQISAGGVIFRRLGDDVEIALVCVGDQRRWQLPKGLVEPNEQIEYAAAREVREETGIDGELIGTIDTIEYWYVARERAGPIRYHKFVHFFLFSYRSGDVSAHDHEVLEARWASLPKAHEMLAFPSERRVVEQAEAIIAALQV